MRPEDTLVITRIKTDELARQFAALTARSAELRSEEATLDEPRARFALLHRGLAALAARGQVFEDASFADGLAEEIGCDTASEEAVEAGVARLSRELAGATRRGAAAVLYGRLFDESEAERETTAELPGRPEALAALRRYWAAEATIDEPALRELLAECCDGGAGLAVDTSPFTQGVSPDEVRGHLHVLARSFDHRAEFRAYCRRLIHDADAVNDLGGALTILLRDLDRFQWDDWPTPVTLRWNRTRWRAFLDPELIPQLLLEAVALRLGVLARGSWLPRTLRSRRLVWDTLDHRRTGLTAALVLPGMGTSIAEYEHQAPSAYVGAGSITGEPDPFQRLFTLVNADIWWHTTAFAGAPVYVAQTDIKDFFPSLPHATVRELLTAMGAPATAVSFVERYLRGPYRLEGEPLPVRTGLFPGNTLSRVVADSLLIALDTWVERTTRVPVDRFMDDIYWVTHEAGATAAAWSAIEHFCRTAGLQLSDDKTAVSGLHEAPPPASTPALASLPARPIRWSFLELDEHATWVPRAAALDEFTAALRTRLTAPAPARQLVREYNAAVGYLVRGLAPLAPLGVEHVDRLRAPLGRIHAHLFGPRHGAVAHVRERLAARLPELAELIAALPDGWFHWPITAGGLGLYNPASLLAGARAALRDRPPSATPTPAPVDAPRQDSTWTMVYEERAGAEVRVAPPTSSPAMAGRQRDFIARGGELRGHEQGGLHPYWQWLLETHAPSLLDFFGTLRFLPTEVVPVQPLGASPRSLVAAQSSGSSDDDIPF